jgi:hypothetical protein
MAADFVTTFYHLQVGSFESQEFRTCPVPYWLLVFPIQSRTNPTDVLAISLPDGTAVQPRVAERL